MAKGRGGRPKKAEGEKATRHVRVFNDIADMIGWIYYFESRKVKTSVAQIIDPLIRDRVVERFGPYQAPAEAVKKAQAQADEPPLVKKPKGRA